MYSLYSTLSSKIPSGTLTTDQRKELVSKLESIEDTRKRCAIVMLIAEHYRLETDGKIINGGQVPLPYGIVQNKKNLEIDIEALPRELQWILYKFSNLGS